ncbi:uncharacterized protein [Heliangelus exortis]|uniref:uncharacterized protein isoform X1 n=1 Tax=Heliangelus exortis TaxID=472823 RepID=UPI003A944144
MQLLAPNPFAPPERERLQGSFPAPAGSGQVVRGRLWPRPLALIGCSLSDLRVRIQRPVAGARRPLCVFLCLCLSPAPVLGFGSPRHLSLVLRPPFPNFLGGGSVSPRCPPVCPYVFTHCHHGCCCCRRCDTAAPGTRRSFRRRRAPSDRVPREDPPRLRQRSRGHFSPRCVRGCAGSPWSRERSGGGAARDGSRTTGQMATTSGSPGTAWLPSPWIPWCPGCRSSWMTKPSSLPSSPWCPRS